MADGTATVRPYWANEREPATLIQRCLERVAWHMQALKASGRWGSMMSLLSAYYGAGTDGQRDSGELRDAGDDGETVEMHTNQVRPVIANTMSLIVGQWPEVKPRAVNQGAKALAEARLALDLHEFYERRTSGRSRVIDAVRGGLLASSWNVGHSWAPQDGKEWALDEKNQPIYEGDFHSFVLPPWRCVWDFAAADESSRKWVLFRRPVSRYDTAANVEKTQPDVALKLRQHVDVSSSAVWAKVFSANDMASIRSIEVLLGEKLPPEDVIWVWELRHLPTPALPTGRLLRFLEPDIILWDSLGLAQPVPYPYDERELHVREYSPERTVSGSAGHTGAFDLAGLQEFVDLCTASIASTVNVNGQNRFHVKGEGGTQVRGLGLDGAVIETPADIEVLNFPALKAEVIQAVNWGIEQMRQAMALNNVVMGQPDKGMPAQAMALLKATAIQYHAVAQGDFVRLVEWSANSRLRILKRFAKADREAELVGKARKYELKKWSEKDIAGVPGFDVEPVNPAANTFESRAAIGEMLVQRGLMNAESYLAFVQTGNLEQGLATKTAQKELVESNLELLQSGVGLPPVDNAAMAPLMAGYQQQVQQAAAAGLPPPNPPLPVFAKTPPNVQVLRILKSDPHHLTIPAYVGVLASPASRADAKLMKAATEAIELSLQYWQSLTPDESACYGIPPLPSQLAASARPGGAPGGAPGEGSPPDEAPPGQPPGEKTPEEGAIEQPKDPMTGEQAPAAAPV